MKDKPFYAYKDDELVPMSTAKEAIREIVKERDAYISAYRQKALRLACDKHRDALNSTLCLYCCGVNPCPEVIKEVDSCLEVSE